MKIEGRVVARPSSMFVLVYFSSTILPPAEKVPAFKR